MKRRNRWKVGIFPKSSPFYSSNSLKHPEQETITNPNQKNKKNLL